MNKYGNKKTIVCNIKFDSQKEAHRYLQLLDLERQGKVKCIKLQPKFILQPGYYYKGKAIREIAYKADFEYIDCELNKLTYEDVKGMKTKEYLLKKKILLYQKPYINFIET